MGFNKDIHFVLSFFGKPYAMQATILLWSGPQINLCIIHIALPIEYNSPCREVMGYYKDTKLLERQKWVRRKKIFFGSCNMPKFIQIVRLQYYYFFSCFFQHFITFDHIFRHFSKKIPKM